MKAQDTVFSQKVVRIFSSNAEVQIMGILNITPDSFYDGGSYLQEQEWLNQTQKIVDEGADIIDIGGQSTRPNATVVSAEEEAKRLIPVVKSIRNRFPELLISVDTFYASVAELAANAGANIINDISGGTFDEVMFTTIARLDIPYILMHNNGSISRMHDKDETKNIRADVASFLETQIAKLKAFGFTKIIIDPGFGFGKTLEQNYELLTDFDYLKALPYPILAGISRKSMITKLLNIKTKDALNGTTALNMQCILAGAKLLRVHDVKEAKEVVKIAGKLAHKNSA